MKHEATLVLARAQRRHLAHVLAVEATTRAPTANATATARLEHDKAVSDESVAVSEWRGGRLVQLVELELLQVDGEVVVEWRRCGRHLHRVELERAPMAEQRRHARAQLVGEQQLGQIGHGRVRRALLAQTNRPQVEHARRLLELAEHNHWKN